METEPETAADFYDLVVSDIGYVIDRPPNPAWRLVDFSNPWVHILAVALSGQAEYEIDGESCRIGQGDVILMPKGLVHSGASAAENPWHFASVGFDMRAGSGRLDRQLETLPYVTRAAAFVDASARFAELQSVWADRQPGYLMQARAIVTTILHRIIAAHSAPRLRSPHARRITKVLEMILANYHQTYSVTDLADVAGLSPSHFRVMFKQMTGHTVTAYQQRVKIEKATELLLSGEYNVTQTALRTGFHDVYYFSRLYKKVTGRNPSELART